MFRKILSFYTKYFAIWVVLFGATAYLYPAPFISIKGCMNWFFALTMFGIGVVMEKEDFKQIIKNPMIVVIGCCAEILIMPLGAFAIAKIFRFSPELTVGLILTGAAPAAMSSNVMSYIAKADTAYSISLTTVLTLLCPLLTPGLTLLLAGTVLEVKFLEIFLTVIYTVILPLFAGFFIRNLFKDKILKIIEIFPAISVTFIVFICSLVIAQNRDYLAKITFIILIAGIILNIYGMLGGYWVAKLFKMNIRRRRTLAIEVGMQNAGLGAVLALKHFGPRAAIPAAIFVFICIISASVMAEIWQRQAPENN